LRRRWPHEDTTSSWRLDTHKIEPHILINYASFGLNSAFVDHDPVRLRARLQPDVITLMKTCDQYSDQTCRHSLVPCPLDHRNETDFSTKEWDEFSHVQNSVHIESSNRESHIVANEYVG